MLSNSYHIQQTQSNIIIHLASSLCPAAAAAAAAGGQTQMLWAIKPKQWANQHIATGQSELLLLLCGLTNFIYYLYFRL